MEISKQCCETVAIRTKTENIAQSFTNSIFEESWWLDAVAPGRWGKAEIKSNGSSIAILPYVQDKTGPFRLIRMPSLTQTLGPWISEKIRVNTASSKEAAVIDELVGMLPKHDYFMQRMHHSFSNWLPLYWQNFEQTTLYTYIIREQETKDLVFKNMQPRIKNAIKKWEHEGGVSVFQSDDIEQFLILHEKTFLRQGRSLPYRKDLVRRLDTACAARGARKIYFGKDSQGNIHAAAYIVNDANYSYYLMSGSDPLLRESNALTFCLWEAIKGALDGGRKFDFEGSMIKPIEFYFRGFGPSRTAYSKIWKHKNNFTKALYNIRSTLRR
ncbi:GNAT family N-acetyltransferase [Variovorax terrae]|uniref:GNAT family N-acetyltransferase n=1 Tax=Variovorax terrae TaxID=2923278 RepID=A0A9X1VV19_9BURK|nr:GNAT family N-acetyltransferase [Variovorax terrae]MCJ0764326.1 GNAT family N-acetyltransferase [Variovorax terrae]